VKPKPNKKNKTLKSKRRKQKKSIFAFIYDGRGARIAGSILMLLSIYTVIALISYLFTWQSDQSAIFQLTWSEVFSSSLILDNHLGRLGGLLSHQLIFKWFGLASFIIPLLMFLAAIKLLFPFFKQIDFQKYLGYGVFFMAWTSMFLSFIWGMKAFAYGGGFGNSMCLWLNSFVGSIGTLAFLICLLCIIGFLRFNFTLDFNFPTFKMPTFGQSDVERSNIQTLETARTAKTSKTPKTPNKGFNFKFPSFKRWFNFSPALKTAGGTAANQNEIKGNTYEFKQSEIKKPKGKATLLDINESLSLEILNPESPHAEAAGGDPNNPNTLIIEEDVALRFPELIKKQETPMDLQVNKSAVNHAGDHLTVDTNYDPTLDLSDYIYPDVDLLELYGGDKITIDR